MPIGTMQREVIIHAKLYTMKKETIQLIAILLLAIAVCFADNLWNM